MASGFENTLGDRRALPTNVRNSLDFEEATTRQGANRHEMTRRPAIAVNDKATLIDIEADMEGVCPANRVGDQIADDRIGAGCHIDGNATTIVDARNVNGRANLPTARAYGGTHTLAVPLDADEFGGDKLHLAAGHSIAQSLVQIGRQAVTMDVPP